MPPRKAATPQNKPKVVRRVVKKIITEEVIEEIIDDQPTPEKPATPKKLSAKSGIKKATVKKTKAEPKKAKPATPKKTPAGGAAQKAKTPAKRAKAETKPKPRVSKAKKEPTTTPKARKTPQKDAATNSAKSLSVKPAITKTRKPASKTAKTSAKTHNPSLPDPVHPPIFNSQGVLGLGSSAMPNPPPPMLRAKHVKQTARKSGAQISPSALERLCHTGGNVPPPMPRAKRVKQTARKSAGIPASQFKTEAVSQSEGIAQPPMPRARKIKQTARRTGTPSGRLASSSAGVSNTSNDQYVWELTHETGYVPDGFHSYMEPTKRNLGTFSTREAAVQRGKRAVGSEVGYSWNEVQESGELETVSDSPTVWEICWSPPDSEYSNVTARRINTAAGRWVVDVQHGYPPSGFHSYEEPTKKQLGPYQSRATAVGIAKRQVGAVYGISWEEVVEGGDLDVAEDSSQKWEVSWTPPDSEHSYVVARMLPVGVTGEDADVGSASRGRDNDSNDDNDSDDDDGGFYNLAF